MKRSSVFLLVLALALPLGCAKRHRISIQSDTCWDGIIDNQSNAHIDGCGDSSYRVAGEMHCVVVQKQTDVGVLRVRIDEGLWVETSEPRGLVQVCR